MTKHMVPEDHRPSLSLPSWESISLNESRMKGGSMKAIGRVLVLRSNTARRTPAEAS